MQSFASFVVAVTISADPNSAAFQTFTSAPGRFSVDMPGKPTETVDKKADYTQYSFSAFAPGPSVFRVQYPAFSPNETPKFADAQEGLKRFRSGFRQGKTIEGDKEVSLGAEKVPGREYWLEADKGVFVRERLFFREGRIYISHVVSQKRDFLTSVDANRYFDSFAFSK